MNVRFAVLSTTCGLGIAIALAVAQAETPVPAAQEAVPDSLEEVRATIGSPTAGSIFDSAIDSQSGDAASASTFAEAYQRLASQQRGETSPIVDARECLPSPDPRGRFVSALREAARVLEATAADLEDVEAYQEADELRDRAEKLRRDARRTGDSSPGKVLEK